MGVRAFVVVCVCCGQRLRDEVAIAVILFSGQANYVVTGFGRSAATAAAAAVAAAAHENRK